jgi:hypothetical protein
MSSLKGNIMKIKNHRNNEMYPFCYIYKGRKTYLIWQTKEDGKDSFRLDLKNLLISSRSERKLRDLLGNKARQLKWSESAEVNIDHFWNALRGLKVGKSSSTDTCKILLNGWNFIEDLVKTVGHTEVTKGLHSPLLNKVYEKLFYGNNLPAITPQGKSYSPLWMREEIVSLRKEFYSIWKILKESGYITKE